MVTLDELRKVAEAAVAGDAPGRALTTLERELIGFGLAASPTALDGAAMRRHARAALAAGASAEALTCVMLLVAAVGNHALHEGVRELRAVLDETDPELLAAPLAGEQVELQRRFEGDSSYWRRLEEQLPGFLEGLLRLSPVGYEGFFDFCGLAWQVDSVEPLTKELVYLAIDATPTHRYGPGFRLHLGNARRLGASAQQIRETLDLAAGAPEHVGVP